MKVRTVAAVIAHASEYFTLEPGDLIHLGTAARGKYRMRDIDFRTRTGIRMIEIESIGRLINPIVHID